MTRTATQFDDAELNTWSDPETFTVTRERIAAYAEATNDPIPAHRNGDIAPPVFAIVPAFDSLLVPVVDVVPAQFFGKVVHGEQDFHFHRPIVPGDVLSTRARAIGYDTVASGARLSIHLETVDRVGESVNDQYLIAFFRGIDAGDAVGQRVPENRLDTALRDQPPTASVPAHIDADQTYRYAPASGDPMPIHLDEQVARDAGLPGIIAHGLCAMAFTSWAVLTTVGDSDTRRLRRFAVRFAAMTFPNDDITTRVWETGVEDDGARRYAFDAVRAETPVITDGFAVIAPA